MKLISVLVVNFDRFAEQSRAQQIRFLDDDFRNVMQVERGHVHRA
jgi:hypothetical protein